MTIETVLDPNKRDDDGELLRNRSPKTPVLAGQSSEVQVDLEELARRARLAESPNQWDGEETL